MNIICPKCEGDCGYYWDAPVYHNERQREWATCGTCGGDGLVNSVTVNQGLDTEDTLVSRVNKLEL